MKIFQLLHTDVSHLLARSFALSDITLPCIALYCFGGYDCEIRIQISHIVVASASSLSFVLLMRWKHTKHTGAIPNMDTNVCTYVYEFNNFKYMSISIWITKQTKKWNTLTTWIISCKPGPSHRMPSLNITRFIYCTRISFHSIPFENSTQTVHLLNFQVRNQRLTNSTKRYGQPLWPSYFKYCNFLKLSLLYFFLFFGVSQLFVCSITAINQFVHLFLLVAHMHIQSNVIQSRRRAHTHTHMNIIIYTRMQEKGSIYLES